MNNKITKFAAVAIIIIAVLFGINPFSKSVAFALDDVWAATAKTEWVHMTYQYTDHDIELNNVLNQRSQIWMSVEPYRLLLIYKNGTVSFIEYNRTTKLRNSQNYDPLTNTITSIYRYVDKKDLPTNLTVMFGNDFSKMEDKGAKIEYSDSLDGERPIKIITIDHTDDNGVYGQSSLIVDVETRLPISMTNNIMEKSGKKTTSNVVFDYPEVGPTDIYQAGVPRDTKIKVIDHRPAPEFLEVIKPYREAANNLPKQCIVLEVAKENDARSVVSIEYNNDSKKRFEQLRCNNGEPPIEADEIKTILEWTNGVSEGELGIQLNDGTMVYCANRDYFGHWTNETKPVSHYKTGLRIGGLTERGWPKIKLGKAIQNSYASENGFLCIETIREPSYGVIELADTKLEDTELTDTILFEAAKKTLYYLDPMHDYMCIYIESFMHPVRYKRRSKIVPPGGAKTYHPVTI